jgi:hypothetical protein
VTMKSGYQLYLFSVSVVKNDMSDKLDIFKYQGKEVKIIQNVRAYIDENDVAHINAEDTARRLGFTQDKNGVEYIRLETINRYLADSGFSQEVGKDDFIPEGCFTVSQ